VVTALWIIYGAAIALRMAVFTQMAISVKEGMLWGALAVLLGVCAYLKESFARKNNDNAIRGLRDQLIRLQAYGEGTASAMGRSLARMGALPETNPKGEEIVDELKEGLKELVKTLAESARPQIVPVTLSRNQNIFYVGLLGILVLVLVLVVGLAVKNIYDEFPNPLSPIQMSDLVDRLRKEHPQRLRTVRKADRKSIALAEQFRKVFESAHWVLVAPPQLPSNGAVLYRGLVIWRAPDDLQALAVSRLFHYSSLPYETSHRR
jgi:hypothetical protein